MPQRAEEVRAVLAATPLAQGLTSSRLDDIVYACEVADIPAESTLWSEGDPTKFFAIVVSGIVAMGQRTPQGRLVVVELLGAGDSTGLLATLGSIPHPLTATAVCDSRVVKVPSEPWRKFSHEEPAILARTVADVVPRMLGGFKFLATMSHAEVEHRVAVALLRLAELCGRSGGSRAEIPLTRRVLATVVGTTVESAIRVTSKWQKRGWLAGHHGRIEILDFDALKNVATHQSCSFSSANSA